MFALLGGLAGALAIVFAIINAREWLVHRRAAGTTLACDTVVDLESDPGAPSSPP